MKSMKTLLKLLGAVSLTTVAASSVVACNETNIFKTINNWGYHNGEIKSLVNNNGTIYAGTRTADGKGKLYKITNDNVSLVSSWTDTNGEIYSLVNNNGTIYVGTADGRNRGQLFKEINN